jgi:osmotically-inducible protein OsmY
MRLFTFIFGAAAGAAAAWFLDPDNGNRRRSVAQDKAGKYARKGAAEAERKARDAGAQVKGAAVQASPVGGRADAGERLNDAGLKAKVESEIFRDADAPKDKVSVNVEDRVVVLRGEVESPEQVTRLVREAGNVDGVQDVRNLLHGPDEPVPSAPGTSG